MVSEKSPRAPAVRPRRCAATSRASPPHTGPSGTRRPRTAPRCSTPSSACTAPGAAARRKRSELTALEVDDLMEELDGSGALLVRRDKTDPEGRGAMVYLAPDTVALLRNSRVCSSATGREPLPTDRIPVRLSRANEPERGRCTAAQEPSAARGQRQDTIGYQEVAGQPGNAAGPPRRAPSDVARGPRRRIDLDAPDKYSYREQASSASAGATGGNPVGGRRRRRPSKGDV